MGPEFRVVCKEPPAPAEKIYLKNQNKFENKTPKFCTLVMPSFVLLLLLQGQTPL